MKPSKPTLEEVWKDVKGYEDKYKVSNFGNVLSLSFNKSGIPKLLSPGVNSSGYRTINFCKDGESHNYKIYKLVAIHFLGHIPCGYKEVVNHIDFNRLNDRVDNLELTSARNNSNRKHIKSTSDYTGVSRLKNRWRASMSIGRKSKHIGLYLTELEASKAYEKAVKELNK